MAIHQAGVAEATEQTKHCMMLVQAATTRNQLRICLLLQLWCVLAFLEASGAAQDFASSLDGTPGTVSPRLPFPASGTSARRSVYKKQWSGSTHRREPCPIWEASCVILSTWFATGSVGDRSDIVNVAQVGPAHRRHLVSISSLSDAQFSRDLALCHAASKVRAQIHRCAGPRNSHGLHCPKPVTEAPVHKLRGFG